MEPEEEVDVILIEKALAVAERKLSTATMNHRGAVLAMDRLRDSRASDSELARQARRVRLTEEFEIRHQAMVADLRRKRDEIVQGMRGVVA